MKLRSVALVAALALAAVSTPVMAQDVSLDASLNGGMVNGNGAIGGQSYSNAESVGGGWAAGFNGQATSLDVTSSINTNGNGDLNTSLQMAGVNLNGSFAATSGVGNVANGEGLNGFDADFDQDAIAGNFDGELSW